MAELKNLIVNGSARVNGPLYVDELLLTNITYSELKSLRDNSGLIPGKQYRITDYNTTVADIRCAVGNHQFDIIVVADDENHLNEAARAIKHEGDTYFPETTKFEAWELKYCLDNDTERFDWALDGYEGKGVIYWMKDEFNNECPYDFKNIMFYRKWNTDTQLWSDIPDGTTMTSFIPCYTFSSEGTSTTTSFTDMSLSASNNVYSNVIKEYSNNKLMLNNNCFFGTYCFYNTFGEGCISNTFGNSCSNNTFRNNCRANTFGEGCYYNTFGEGFISNTFEDSCNLNTFGNNCFSNTFGVDCNHNTFGNNCRTNTFRNDCNCNIFKNGVQSFKTTISGTVYTFNYCTMFPFDYSNKVWQSAVSATLERKFIGLNTEGNIDCVSFERIVELN